MEKKTDRVEEGHWETLPEAGNQVNRRHEMVESLKKLHKCANCAIRCRASRKPRSLFARVHRWHATWWPGWKLYQAELAGPRAKAMPRV